MFWCAYKPGGGGLMYGPTFMSRVFHTCYLHLKKEEWNKTKNNALAAKCYFTS